MSKELTKTEIKNIVKTELDKDISKYVETELKKLLNKTQIQKEIKKLSIEVLIKFYKTLWTRNSFWKEGLDK